MSDTAFVNQVPYSGTVPYAPIKDVDRIVGDIEEFRDDQIADLNAAILNLSSINVEYTPKFGAITTVIPDLNAPGFSPAPPLDFDPNESWPINNIPDPNILPNAQDYTFVTPPPLGTIDPSFDYSPGSYGSSLWDELYENIREGLANGGTGLTAAVYAAIIARNQEARRNIEDVARQRAYDAVGENGFDLPGGQAAAVVLELEKDRTAKDYDAVNNLTIKDFDLADANTKFTKELSVKMEQLSRTTFESEQVRLFEIAKVTEEMIIAVYEVNAKVYIAQWEGVKIKVEAAKAASEAIIAQNNGEIQVFLGRIEAFSKEIDAIAAENKARADVTIAQATIYEKEVDAIAAQISAEVEKVKAKIEEYRMELEEVLDKERINLAAYTDSATLTERISESLANIAAQSVASALGALNTSMSIGYSGSESRAYHASISNTLSEGHSYEEE